MIVYRAINAENGKTYVGKTTSTLEHRRWGHGNSAVKGSRTAFHAAIRKYGLDSFVFEEIGYCNTKDNLNNLEQFFISFLQSKCPNGYNITNGGDGNDGSLKPNLGLVMPEKTKKKIRQKRALQVITTDTRVKMSEGQKRAYAEGRRIVPVGIPSGFLPFPPGHIPWNKGMDGFLSGRIPWNKGLTKESNPSVACHSKKMTGKPAWNKGLTKETDDRISGYSESLKRSTSVGVFKRGQTAWNKGLKMGPIPGDGRLQRSETMKGIPKSPETKLKMIEAQRKRRAEESLRNQEGRQ